MTLSVWWWASWWGQCVGNPWGYPAPAAPLVWIADNDIHFTAWSTLVQALAPWPLPVGIWWFFSYWAPTSRPVFAYLANVVCVVQLRVSQVCQPNVCLVPEHVGSWSYKSPYWWPSESCGVSHGWSTWVGRVVARALLSVTSAVSRKSGSGSSSNISWKESWLFRWSLELLFLYCYQL